MTKSPVPPGQVKATVVRKRHDNIFSVVYFVLSPLAMIAGLVVSISLGYTLGPVLEWRQRRAVLLGALVASTLALLGVRSGLRARSAEQRGGTVGLVLNGLLLAGIWLVALIALFV